LLHKICISKLILQNFNDLKHLFSEKHYFFELCRCCNKWALYLYNLYKSKR